MGVVFRGTIIACALLAAVTAWAAPRGEEISLPAPPEFLTAPQQELPPPNVEHIATPGPEFDPYFSDQRSYLPWQPNTPDFNCYGECWTDQLMPEGLVYRSYLAGPKESRFSSFWYHEEK